VTIELIGASATPLLVGVTISCDRKTTEVMRTSLVPSADVVATGGRGTSSVAASKGFLELVDEVVVGPEELDALSEDDVAADADAFGCRPLPSFCPGQPEVLHGSTEQQPLKPFELHV